MFTCSTISTTDNTNSCIAILYEEGECSLLECIFRILALLCVGSRISFNTFIMLAIGKEVDGSTVRSNRNCKCIFTIRKICNSLSNRNTLPPSIKEVLTIRARCSISSV